MPQGLLLNAGDTLDFGSMASAFIVVTGGGGGTVVVDLSSDGSWPGVPAAMFPADAPAAPETSRALPAAAAQGWWVITAGSARFRVRTPTGFAGTPATVFAQPTATPY